MFFILFNWVIFGKTIIYKTALGNDGLAQIGFIIQYLGK